MQKEPFNRTILELKLMFLHRQSLKRTAFNRTILELKYGRDINFCV